MNEKYPNISLTYTLVYLRLYRHDYDVITISIWKIIQYYKNEWYSSSSTNFELKEKNRVSKMFKNK